MLRRASATNLLMKKKCSNCHLVNFAHAVECARCQSDLIVAESVEATAINRRPGFLVRATICLVVCLVAVLGFYFSLVVSASSLTIEQKSTVRRATGILKDKGFTRHAFLLENLTVYRSNDNWLNASVAKENAYAATNFPFEIMTLYPDFFTYPADDVERAAILLHEAEHLKGHDEHDAYKFVWENRKALGWEKKNMRRRPSGKISDNRPSITPPNYLIVRKASIATAPNKASASDQCQTLHRGFDRVAGLDL